VLVVSSFLGATRPLGRKNAILLIFRRRYGRGGDAAEVLTPSGVNMVTERGEGLIKAHARQANCVIESPESGAVGPDPR